MYHPYFRGKQYELITIKEMALVIRAAGFCPVIEPVRESLNGLQKALDTIVAVGGNAVVIVNPEYGDLSKEGAPLTRLLNDRFLELPNISAGILLKETTTTSQALKIYETHSAHRPIFIHAGFNDARAFRRALDHKPKPTGTSSSSIIA